MSEKKSDTHISKYQEIINECKLLYRHVWGFECKEGWYEPLHNLSYRLECINYAIRRKWGITIEADQVKEKYGQLRFYYTLQFHVPFWRKLVGGPFVWHASRVDPDATGIEKRISMGLSKFFYSLGYRIFYGTRRHQARMQQVVLNAVGHYVDQLIAECVEDCYNVCEHCGKSFSYTPRCMTHGWMSFVCEDCAVKNGQEYEYELSNEEKAQFEHNPKHKQILSNLGKVMFNRKPVKQPAKKQPVATQKKKSKTASKNDKQRAN